MPRAKKKERSLAMYEHIAALNSVEECCRFFDDLCAVTELRAMEQRFDVAKMLHNVVSSSMDYSNRMTSLCGICFPGDVAP